jgi:hypothetical protein
MRKLEKLIRIAESITLSNLRKDINDASRGTLDKDNLVCKINYDNNTQECAVTIAETPDKVTSYNDETGAKIKASTFKAKLGGFCDVLTDINPDYSEFTSEVLANTKPKVINYQNPKDVRLTTINNGKEPKKYFAATLQGTFKFYFNTNKEINK